MQFKTKMYVTFQEGTSRADSMRSSIMFLLKGYILILVKIQMRLLSIGAYVMVCTKPERTLVNLCRQMGGAGVDDRIEDEQGVWEEQERRLSLLTQDGDNRISFSIATACSWAKLTDKLLPRRVFWERA